MAWVDEYYLMLQEAGKREHAKACLAAAEAVCEALEAFRTLPADGSNRALQGLYRAHDAWRAVRSEGAGGAT